MSGQGLLKLDVNYRPLEGLRPNPKNARTHSKRQVRLIADSLKTFGFINPVLIDDHDMIVAGHGRLQAAKMLGLTEVPTIRVDHLTDDEKRAYILADNQLAARAGWDPEILAIELQHLSEVIVDFEITVTGFEVPEVDMIIEGGSAKDKCAEKIEPIDRSCPPVSMPGILWRLGPHRILCGNTLEAASNRLVMGDRRASLVFTDPPYNVPIRGHVSGSDRLAHREFVMASGEMSEEAFIDFLATAMRHALAVSEPAALHYWAMDWKHLLELQTAARQCSLEQINLAVWCKNQPGMGSFYRSQHELFAIFRQSGERHRNNIQLGAHGRNRSNVWNYPGASTFSKSGEEGRLNELHPTVKPVSLVADAMLDCTKRGQVILDPFLGSGTTLMAAERVGRICHAIELDPIYVDVALQRWQSQTGEKAIDTASGLSFEDLAARQREARRDG
jgi:DNA modification methylase